MDGRTLSMRLLLNLNLNYQSLLYFNSVYTVLSLSDKLTTFCFYSYDNFILIKRGMKCNLIILYDPSHSDCGQGSLHFSMYKLT